MLAGPSYQQAQNVGTGNVDEGKEYIYQVVLLNWESTKIVPGKYTGKGIEAYQRMLDPGKLQENHQGQDSQEN